MSPRLFERLYPKHSPIRSPCRGHFGHRAGSFTAPAGTPTQKQTCRLKQTWKVDLGFRRFFGAWISVSMSRNEIVVQSVVAPSIHIQLNDHTERRLKTNRDGKAFKKMDDNYTGRSSVAMK